MANQGQTEMDFYNTLRPKLLYKNSTNTVFLMVHVLFAFFYYKVNTPILFYYNLFSICFFLFQYYIIYKKHDILFILMSFAEIAVFTVINVVCLGWDFGFQMYFYSYMVAAILCDFYVHSDSSSGIRPYTYILIFASIAFFMIMRVYFYSHDPIYTFDDPTPGRVFYFCNSLISGIQLINYTIIFVNTVYKLETRLRDYAMRDTLTGLYNRRSLQHILADRMSENGPKPERNAMAMIDIDFFKKINDTYGHDAGDLVLQSMSEILKDKIEKEDDFICARVGGEEFVLMYGGTSRDQVIDFYRNLQKELSSSPVDYRGKTIHYTVSMGVAFYHEGANPDDDQKLADKLLYEAKESGRNRVIFGE